MLNRKQVFDPCEARFWRSLADGANVRTSQRSLIDRCKVALEEHLANFLDDLLGTLVLTKVKPSASDAQQQLLGTHRVDLVVAARRRFRMTAQQFVQLPEQAADLVKAGGVYVNRLRVRLPMVRVAAGERITVYRGALTAEPFRPRDIQMVYRDPSFVVVDKPAGVAVAPTRTSARGTLSEARPVSKWTEHAIMEVATTGAMEMARP